MSAVVEDMEADQVFGVSTFLPFKVVRDISYYAGFVSVYIRFVCIP